MTTPRQTNYVYGRGEVSIARFLPGTQVPAGFNYVGNTPAFGFTTTVQELDHFNSDHGVGELDFSIPTQVTRAGTLTTDDIQADNLAMATFGTKATVTQTAATAIVEPTFAGVIPGLEYQLGRTTQKPTGVRNVTNVVVKVATVTKVVNVDYTVDLARGLVKILDTGTIASGASVDVTYDAVASSFDQVISGNTPIEGALMFKADNPAGINRDILLPWVRITPNGEYALKADNALQQLQFSLKVLKITGLAACYINGQPYIGS